MSAGQVIHLTEDDAVRYVYVRQRMLIDDWSISGRAPVATYSPSAARTLLGDHRSATFGIADPLGGSYGPLIAVATVTRNAHHKYAHRARLLSVFVDPPHRGKRLGEAVVAAAVEYARSWRVEFVDLCVNGNAVPAQRLYARLGFVQWGRQQEAVDSDGNRLDEIHMTLSLRDQPAPFTGAANVTRGEQQLTRGE